MYHWYTFVLKVVKTTLLVLGALHFYITAWTARICNLAIGSMGKLVNPFASHAKDPRFEPEWNQVAQASCHVHFFVLSNPETLN